MANLLDEVRLDKVIYSPWQFENLKIKHNILEYQGPEPTWQDREEIIKILQQSAFDIVTKTFLIAEKRDGTGLIFKSPLLQALLELLEVDKRDAQFLAIGGAGDFYTVMEKDTLGIGRINKSKIRVIRIQERNIEEVLASGLITW